MLFVKDIIGPTDKTGTWMRDLIKALYLYLYQFPDIDNCAVVIQNNTPSLGKHSLMFIGLNGNDICNLLSSSPGKNLISK